VKGRGREGPAPLRKFRDPPLNPNPKHHAARICPTYPDVHTRLCFTSFGFRCHICIVHPPTYCVCNIECLCIVEGAERVLIGMLALLCVRDCAEGGLGGWFPRDLFIFPLCLPFGANTSPLTVVHPTPVSQAPSLSIWTSFGVFTP